MEFLVVWAIISGMMVVPGLFNYFVNLYYAPSGTAVPSRLELLAASFAVTFAVLTFDILMVLLVSLAWDGLRSEIADFVHLGLEDFGRERPIALTGVLTAVSVACIAVMSLMGAARIPGRFLR